MTGTVLSHLHHAESREECGGQRPHPLHWVKHHGLSDAGPWSVWQKQDGARFLVEVLAKEIGHRGVTVNAILPTATTGAGRHAEPKPEIADFIKNFMPMNRIGTVEDTANASEYLASFVSGQHLLLSGGGPA